LLRARDVLFRIVRVLSAGNGDYVVVPCEHRRQRELRRLAAFLFRDFLVAAREVEILLEMTCQARICGETGCE